MGGHLSRGGDRSHELLLKGQVKALLPTPSANDHTGAEGPTRAARAKRHGTGGSSLRDIPYMLPTPMANDANPGAGGELRAAVTHGPSRRNETGTDSWGRANHGRRGAPTNPPSDDGNTSEATEHPGQLTIEDA